jgi:1-acyl-sn-glycerol-3-phosphate acyltransferase
MANEHDQELFRQLLKELNELSERVQALTPESPNGPPRFSRQRLLKLLEQNLDQIAPGAREGVLKQLGGVIGEDIFDLETWKGLWFLLSYTVKTQADVVRRRFTGEYEVDEWGVDWEFIETVIPFLTFMYKVYWRVETRGMENIPSDGRVLLVSNHSGQLPWDGLMIGAAVWNEHPAQRLVRTLYAASFGALPFFAAALVKMGQALATVENGVRLLEQDELVAVFPEGTHGLGKLYKERYKLARFGRGEFAKMALATGAPIIPVAVVGAEETYPALAQSDALARLAGVPYFSITPTFPWLGLLGLIPLPTKWTIDFGEPIPMDEYGPAAQEAADNLLLLSQVTGQVRDVVQGMVNERLVGRRSVFLG